MIKNKDYWIHERYSMLQGSELYSGDLDTDPIEQAEFDAHDHIAYDGNGNKLPFSISLSIFGQEIDRREELIENKPKTYRRWDQKICVSIIVFSNMDNYFIYENSDLILEK
jgi:hypothetical protein